MPTTEPDLHHHGDAETSPGLTDLAVNVRLPAPPRWLQEALTESLVDLAAYPDVTRARAAVAARHRRPPEEVLLTAGAAEAFVLLARALRPRHAVVVHPQFTEPEAALAAGGHTVDRVLLHEDDGFRLRPRAVPADADLVVIGNPTNPTSVLHSAGDLARLARPGRTLVVDEAFMDAVPGEPESLAERRDLPGLVVVRSLTKTWGLAGLRVGYLLAAGDLLAPLAAAQPLWAVSTPALVAAERCSAKDAVAEAQRAARSADVDREHLAAGLRRLEVTVAGDPRAPFVLVRLPGADRIRRQLRGRGWALRRGDTFPGLGADWLRIAVRSRDVTDAFLADLATLLRPTPTAPLERTPA